MTPRVQAYVVGIMKILKTGSLLATAVLLIVITASPMFAAGSVSNAGAAGDVTQSSVVLWARSNVLGKVKFKVTPQNRSDGPTRVEHVVVSDPLVPAKVEIGGLDPGTAYEYLITVDDAYIAAYVAKHPDTLIGYLSVDPTQDGWAREMQVGHEELGLRGSRVLPV